jgi:signal peptidase II
VWFVVAVALLVSLDLGSKALAFRTIADAPVVVDKRAAVGLMSVDPRMLQSLVPDHAAVVVVPNVLEFKLVLNPGAVFGAGGGARWFFVGFTMVALAFATWMFAAWCDARDRVLQVGIALIVSGGLGNLFDRVVFGCVRDFIHPMPGHVLPFGLSWPGGGNEMWPYVSNLADKWLLVGIALVLWRVWREETPVEEEAPGTGHRASVGNGG